VHRRASDHWFAAFRREPALRFQCRSAACGWSGLRVPGATLDGDRRRPLVASALVALLVTAAALGLVAVTAEGWLPGDDAEPASAQATATLRPRLQDVEVPVPPAGWHDVGQALPADDARLAGRAAGLQIRQGCTWGAPGRDPYRGTAEQALQAAGLPADAVETIAQRIRRGESDGEVTLARDGIQSADGQRQFGRRLVASTYGMTLCFDTLVNFEEGHVERAPLFEFTSADGRRFSVIVPDVCGNVGVIDEQPPEGIVLGERAERTADPIAPGTSDMPATLVGPAQTGPASAREVAAAPPRTGAGGRPALPPSSMGEGRLPPPGDTELPRPTQPPTPVDRTLPGTTRPPSMPPAVDPGPDTQPPGDLTPPSTPPITPPTTPPTPPTAPPALPPTLPPVTPPITPPTTPTPTPSIRPPVTPPVTPPTTPPSTPPIAPPTTPPPTPPVAPPALPPVTPPIAPPTTAPPTPPINPPTTPPATPPITPPPTPEVPDLPPPTEPPPWIPPDRPWVNEPPLPPIPTDPEPQRTVPAPGTFSTGLLGLAALMLSRRCCRRRQR
jgi:hypothetical protein